MSEASRLTVLAPVAPLMAEPRVASAMISQYLAGRVLEVVEMRDDWYHVCGPDEYEGWLHRGYVASVPPREVRRSMQTSRISIGCVTRSIDGARRAMPFGAFLASTEQVESGTVIDGGRRNVLFPTDRVAITQTARKYFEGTSYLWGGVTPWGADCSGLVQSTFWMHGIQLMRDAWQQSEQGIEGSSDPMAAEPGDLLFFSDRADRFITHVAIALGQASIVHLALGRGGYAVEQLTRAEDPYVEKLLARFVTARRVVPDRASTSGD